MKKNILLISILALIILQPGCDDPNAVTIDELLGKWYFIDGYSTTSLTSNINQNIINSSAPGNGEINVTGQITASLQYFDYFILDSAALLDLFGYELLVLLGYDTIDGIETYSFSTQASFDNTYPFGEFLVLKTDQQSSDYYYRHYMNENSYINFVGDDSTNHLEIDELGDSIKVNPLTLYSIDIDFSSGVPVVVMDSVEISGEITPHTINITAHTPFEYNYSNNLYNDITYFSLEFEDNGLLTGLLELNIENETTTDTLEVTYNLFNDTLTVYNEWLLGTELFSYVDSIDVQLTQDVDHLSLEFQYEMYQNEEDTLLFSLLESIVGMEQNSLIKVQSSDSLVFSQTQPLTRITSRTNQLIPFERKIRNIRKLIKNK